MGKNLKRQLKGLIKGQDNALNIIGFFAAGILLLIAGSITGLPFLGLVGGGCLILGLERIVRRSAEKRGEPVSDLRAQETNREDQLRK